MNDDTTTARPATVREASVSLLHLLEKRRADLDLDAVAAAAELQKALHHEDLPRPADQADEDVRDQWIAGALAGVIAAYPESWPSASNLADRIEAVVDELLARRRARRARRFVEAVECEEAAS